MDFKKVISLLNNNKDIYFDTANYLNDPHTVSDSLLNFPFSGQFYLLGFVLSVISVALNIFYARKVANVAVLPSLAASAKAAPTLLRSRPSNFTDFSPVYLTLFIFTLVILSFLIAKIAKYVILLLYKRCVLRLPFAMLFDRPSIHPLRVHVFLRLESKSAQLTLFLCTLPASASNIKLIGNKQPVATAFRPGLFSLTPRLSINWKNMYLSSNFHRTKPSKHVSLPWFSRQTALTLIQEKAIVTVLIGNRGVYTPLPPSLPVITETLPEASSSDNDLDSMVLSSLTSQLTPPVAQRPCVQLASSAKA